MHARRIAQTLAAFLGGSALSALLLVFILPAPPSQMNNLGNIGELFVLSLIGPILLAWAWGPAPMGALGLLAAVAVPIASIATLFFGFFRSHSYPALVGSALMWSIFGGISVFFAVAGTI